MKYCCQLDRVGIVEFDFLPFLNILILSQKGLLLIEDLFRLSIKSVQFLLYKELISCLTIEFKMLNLFLSFGSFVFFALFFAFFFLIINL